MSSHPATASPSEQRIDELETVDESIAALLHFAGLSLAALHPAPLSDFTSREISLAADDDDDSPQAAADPENRQAEFTKASEAYYSTLNEIQLGLRTSIRHLRLAKASPAPLLDPAFASGGTAKLGLGGVALGDKLKPVADQPPSATSTSTSAPSAPLSLAGMSLEAEGWADLAAALAKGAKGGSEREAERGRDREQS